jgi:hypothetical protein
VCSVATIREQLARRMCRAMLVRRDAARWDAGADREGVPLPDS